MYAQYPKLLLTTDMFHAISIDTKVGEFLGDFADLRGNNG